MFTSHTHELFLIAFHLLRSSERFLYLSQLDKTVLPPFRIQDSLKGVDNILKYRSLWLLYFLFVFIAAVWIVMNTRQVNICRSCTNPKPLLCLPQSPSVFVTSFPSSVVFCSDPFLCEVVIVVLPSWFMLVLHFSKFDVSLVFVSHPTFVFCHLLFIGDHNTITFIITSILHDF